jgi:hypothetical protein
MSSLKEVLEGITTEGFELVRTQFMGLLSQAKDDSQQIARETGRKMERWLVLLAAGDLEEDEFMQLVEAHKRTVRQCLNTMEIEAKVRVEKITIGLIDIAVNKILPVLIV